MKNNVATALLRATSQTITPEMTKFNVSALVKGHADAHVRKHAEGLVLVHVDVLAPDGRPGVLGVGLIGGQDTALPELHH